MTVDEDDDQFVAVLRADLPTEHQQDAMRKRLFAAGLSVSTGLATMSATSAAQGGVTGASTATAATSLVSKLGALSWPAKVALAAVLATPVASLPLWSAKPAARATPSTLARTAPSTQSTSNEPAPKQASAPVLAASVFVADEPTVPLEPVVPGVAGPVAAARRIEAAPALEAESAAEQRAGAPIATGTAAFAPLEAPADSLARQRSTTLAAETALLDRAFAELGAGHRAAAASLIAEHARRFPQGLLRQERERAQARLSADVTRDSKGE